MKTSLDKTTLSNKTTALSVLFVVFFGLFYFFNTTIAATTIQSNGSIDSTNAPTNTTNSSSPSDPNAFSAFTTGNSAGPSSHTSNSGGAGLKSGSSTASTAGNTGACIGGGMLAKLLTSSISSAMGKTVKNAVGGTTATATHVPTTNQNTPEATNQEAITNAHTGSFTIGGTQVGLGYDAIAWCIVNTIIDYIVNSTIAWANSGFKGNPAFLRNPGDFFKNLADQTAAQFIREVAYETGGFDICKPFRAVIATGLAKSYSKNTNIQSCSLTQMQQNMMKSSYTITTPTDWMALTKPQNNQYYSYIQAGSEMQKRIDARNNTARFDLTLNKGFLSQKKCKDDSKPESKTNPCDTTTPGSMIADSLSHTLNIPKDRLVSAQRFDQMIDAVVNNLIKVALSKLLEDTTGKAPSQSVSSDYYTAVANNSVYGANGYGTTGGMGVGGPGGTIGTNGVMMQDILNGARFANQDWNTYALNQINAMGLANIQVSDAARFFPNGVPTPEGYLSIMAAIAKRESGGQAKPKRYQETRIGNGTTFSVGLMSLTQGDPEAGNLTYDDLEDPYNNIRVAVAIMARLLNKWHIINGAVVSGYPAGTGLSQYWGQFHYQKNDPNS
ncbi:MAG: transglycosylase SLT domain-containing protein [bacterium]